MKITELRIGNLVSVANVISPVLSVHEANVVSLGKGLLENYDISEVLPISLTPEILIKAGFKTQDMADMGSYIYLIVNHPYLYLSFNDASIWIGEHNTKVTTLHQLQNLYFALTGEDLTINL